MRNIWKALVALGLTAALSVPLAACSEPSAQTEQEQVYAAYVAYAQAAGEEPLSYEEWLESVRGPQGEKGDTGDTGAAGQDGADGEDGKSAYEIAVENGFVGTEEEWLASLKGDTGATGATGAQGDKGDKGDKGDTGATGPQGEKGDKGDKGDTGATGPQGEKGDKGDTGAAGQDGTDGEDGKSAYEIAVENGFVGTEEEWLASLKGDTGATGATGAQGDKGDKGDKGDTGATGPQGEKGDKGDTGAAGQDGADGEDGVGIADIDIRVNDKWGISKTFTFTMTDESVKEVTYTDVVYGMTYGASSAQDITALLGYGVSAIRLTADISADVVVGEDAEVTLDLGGYTLTNVSGHTITNYGTLTVIDSVGGGVVDNVTHARAALHNDVGAVAVLSGGAFTRSKEAGSGATQNGQNSFYNIRNYGDMTINSGVTVMQSGAFSSLLENGWYDGSQNTSEAPARLTINGGVFSGGLNTIKNDDWGEMTINGGSFENVSQAAVLNWNVANIHGGTYEITGNAQAVILNGHINETMDKGILSVKGVEYTGAPLLAWMSGSGSKDAGTITVYDAQTLQAAIDIAADKTVVLGADIVVGSQGNSATGLTIANKDVTLDFHGFTLENVGLGFALHITGASANVVLKDSSATQSGGVYGGQGGDNQAVRMDGGATVRIDGGNYTVGGDANGLGNSCISIASDSVVSVYGGTFSCETAYNGKYYVLNVQQTTGAAGEFTVYGGTFVNYDPSTGDDALSGNFVAEGYEVVSSEDGDGNTLYTVQKAE